MLAALSAVSLCVRADQIWIGTADNQWTTAANWSGSASPGAADAVIYNNLSTGNLSNWLSQPFSIKGLVVSNAPGPVTIASTSALTCTNGINMVQAAQSLRIAAPLALGANVMNTNLSWNVATGQSLTIAGALSGSGGLYKDGWGTLYLSSPTTFTGNFTNNGGQVWINNSSALGSGTKTVSVANNLMGAGLHLNGTNGNISLASGLSFTLSQNNGAVFNEAGDNILNGSISVYSGGGFAYLLANAGTLTLNGTISLGTTARPIVLGGPANGTVNGAITGTGLPFRKVDAGIWTLKNANNTYSGVTTIEGGTLVLGANATIAKTPSITLLNNAALDVSSVTNATYGANAFYLTPSTTIQTLGGSGNVLGNVAVAPSATAYVVPGGTNAFGTLSFSNNLSLGGGVTLAFDLNTPTTVGGGVNDLITVATNLDPRNATVMVTPQRALTTSGTYVLLAYRGAELSSFNPSVVTDNSTRYSFTLNDAGSGQVSVTANGSNSNLVWSGGNGATWDLLGSYNWNGNAQQFYNVDAVTFDDTSANNAVTLNGTLRPTSVTVSNDAVNYVFLGSGKITGITSLTKAGTGALTNYANGSDFTGPVIVNGGILVVTNVANSGTASALGAGSNVTLNGGTFQWAGPALSAGLFNRPFSLEAHGGSLSSSSVRFYLGGQVSGPGSLTKTGAVQIILGDIAGGIATGASNSYSGGTLVAQGELQFRNPYALGSGKVVVAGGADLAAGGGGSFSTITNNMDLNGDGPSSAGALQVNDNNTSADFGGTIRLVTGASVGTFAGSPVTFTISGPITGPGALKKASHLASTVVLTCPTNSYSGGTLITGGTLQLGNGAVAGSLGSGAVTNNGTLAYYHSDTVTNGLTISGTGGLTHRGSGRLVLTGANTYSGVTTVSGGTLVVNGSLGTNAVNITTGATLGGYGSLGGPVIITGGGTLALGSAIGSLAIGNTLTLGGNTVMKLSKNGTTLANDLIRGLTTLTCGGALNVFASGDPLAAGDSFKLFDAAAYAGAFTATNLPALDPGLYWDTSGLTNGTIAIASGLPVEPPDQPAVSSFSLFTHLPDGNFQITFSGTPGFGYRLWATTNLALTPITNHWSNLASGVFSSVGVTFTDTDAAKYRRRFYAITIP